MRVIWTILFQLTLLLIVAKCQTLNAQTKTIDTLVDAGSYKLFFNIIRGNGTPIIFDAGGGETSIVWADILPVIAEITGTTVIAYDRAGFGKSSFDTLRHGVLNGIIGLETALGKLGYDKKIMLVAHSQGGIYSKLYAYRHPEKIVGAVMIDISSSCWFTDSRLNVFQEEIDAKKAAYKISFPGLYYQLIDLRANFDYIRKIDFPINIPVIDLVSDHPFNDYTEVADWKKCHEEFVKESPNRKGIAALGTGHYIYRDNRNLVIMSILKMYCEVLTGKEKIKVLNRMIDFSLSSLNQNNANQKVN